MKRTLRFHLLFVLALVVSFNVDAQLIVTAKPERPAAIVKTSPPGPAYAWIAEDWQVIHDRYEWIGGRWEPMPMRRSVWVPGRWETRDNGHVWVPGYWRNGLERGNYRDRRDRANEYKEQIIVESQRARLVK